MKHAVENAEQNNCLTTPFSFSVVVPISVQLEVGPTLEVTKFRDDYIIVDYEDAPKLRWKVFGNPSTCAASTGTDWTGTKANQSYTVTGNPFSLTNLLNKLSFKYQLDCTR